MPAFCQARTVFSNWLVPVVLCAIIFIQSHGLVLTDLPLPINAFRKICGQLPVD
jgi:hypothetical protein